jgi:hypothetical protein
MVESAQTLINLMEWVWNEITLPVASSIRDISRPVRQESIRTAEQVFMHLIWHWTYHSGHIGLLALLSGRDYVWTFS